MNSLKSNWKLLGLQAEIVLTYMSTKEAEAVTQAVSPDNVKVPLGLSIITTKQGKKVLTQILCETKLETFIATIDDLLSAVSVAEKAVSAAKTC